MNEKNDGGFGQALYHAALEHGRLCVGIDPHPRLLRQWGLTINAAGVERFARICVEAFRGRVALVKPQVAFFERWGADGYRILERVIADLRSAGTLVVADAKRGDIGSTMSAYAQAWLDPDSPLCVDALTVSPYLGFASLAPALEYCASTGTGLFVLAATSNPEGTRLQRARIGERTVAQNIVDAAADANKKANRKGRNVVGNVGVVVGATVAQPPVLQHLNGPVLVPGIGAQGGGAPDVTRVCAGVEHVALPNVSRAVLEAGPDTSELAQAAARFARVFPGIPCS